MTFVACTIAVALTLSSNAAPGPTVTPVADAAQAPVLRAASRTAPLVERWQMDLQEKRPAALPAMYGTLAALHAFDIYSTRRALGANATEANPLMKGASKNAGAMLAVKALSMAGTIYFTERAWKKNRKGAVILMAVINGATMAIAANNVRNARR